MTKRVVILGMGASRSQFIAAMLDPAGSPVLDAEVWGVNLIGTVIRCDRVFAMDVIGLWRRVFCGQINERMAKLKVPIYTSVPDPAWPTAVAYPIREVLARFCPPGDKRIYLNNTVAFAVALALLEGYTEIALFGCDYNYDGNPVHENGRPCLEYWLGVARGMGVTITIGSESTLMDMNKGHVPYGYPPDFDWDAVVARPRLVEAAE